MQALWTAVGRDVMGGSTPVGLLGMVGVLPDGAASPHGAGKFVGAYTGDSPSVK